MAATAIYLNFNRETEDAFNFYKSIFGGEFIGEINRLSTVPPQEGQPPIAQSDGNLVMHIQLKLPGGVDLHGSDAPETMGFKINKGNNSYIFINLDTREEADQLFAKLSVDGKIEMPMTDMFWGDYFGSFADKYGTSWMISCPSKKV